MIPYRRSLMAIVMLLLMAATAGCWQMEKQAGSTGGASQLEKEGEYRLAGEENFYSGYRALNENGDVRVVVEIPAGTNEKWEVNRENGKLERDFKNGKPRVVQYLPYPGNYGMIPQTLLPEESGGDGDPLDIIVLGPSVPRGTVLDVRIIGMIRMLDGGEQDDKLIGVMRDSHFGDIRTILELEERYTGAAGILEDWFSHYKGPGVMQAGGLVEADAAGRVLRAAVEAYKKSVSGSE